MFEDHLARISSASEALASSIREYSAALSAFGSEVELYYKSGLLDDRMRLRSLVSTVDGTLETIAPHMSHLRFVQISLGQAKNKMVPINSLHPELLARVFSLASACVPSVDIFGSYPLGSCDPEISAKRSSLKKTLAISGVCGYWRHIALDAGDLWTFAPISLSGKAAQRILDSTLVWLDRARITPLDVYLDMALSETSTSRAMLDKVLALPLHSKQIRTLDLCLATKGYLNTLLKDCFSNGAPVPLKILQIQIYGQTDEPSILQSWLARCQELRVLHLNVVTLHDGDFPVLPKLVELQLFSLTLIPLATEWLSNVLHACPSLQLLKLSDIAPETTTSIRLAPAPLSHLRTLVLEYMDIPSVLPLLLCTSSSLSLSITVDELDLSNDNLGDHLSALSGRATITTLQLRTRAIEWQDLHRLLQMFPYLLTLSLPFAPLNELTARTLRGTSELDTDEENASSAFPSLDAIWLTESRIDGEETLRLLVSLQPLKQLKLNYCHLPSNIAITQSKELCDYLIENVPDLEIVDHDEDGEDVHFP